MSPLPLNQTGPRSSCGLPPNQYAHGQRDSRSTNRPQPALALILQERLCRKTTREAATHVPLASARPRRLQRNNTRGPNTAHDAKQQKEPGWANHSGRTDPEAQRLEPLKAPKGSPPDTAP